nr:MAG TPA: YmoB-like protein [Caudoviricetes sp.]
MLDETYHLHSNYLISTHVKVGLFFFNHHLIL